MSSSSTIVNWLLGVCAASASLSGLPAIAHSEPSLARVDFEGKPDPIFNDGKSLVLDIPNTTEAAILASTKVGSKIVIAGSATTTSGSHVFMVGRLNSDGSPDTTFSSDGFALTDFSSTDMETANAVAIDSEQRIVVAGSAGSFFALARYSINGSLDPSFDGDGKVLTSFPGATSAGAAGIALDSGMIVAAGTATTSTDGSVFAVARYDSNGALDSVFSGDGRKLVNFASTSMEVAADVAIDGMGRVVVAGKAWDGLDYRMAIARLTYYGELDTGYDGDGKVFINFSTTPDFEWASSVIVDSQNRVVVGGVSDKYFAVARTTPTGALDSTFGGDGMVRTNFASQQEERISRIAFSGESIVAVGAAFSSSGGWQFAAAVYEDDGDLRTSFDGDGKILIAVGGCDSSLAYATVVVEESSILLAGSSYCE